MSCDCGPVGGPILVGPKTVAVAASVWAAVSIVTAALVVSVASTAALTVAAVVAVAVGVRLRRRAMAARVAAWEPPTKVAGLIGPGAPQLGPGEPCVVERIVAGTKEVNGEYADR